MWNLTKKKFILRKKSLHLIISNQSWMPMILTNPICGTGNKKVIIVEPSVTPNGSSRQTPGDSRIETPEPFE